MRSFLLQPYPCSDNVGRKLAFCAGVGAFITFFLILFKPFGFNELSTGQQWTHALLFGFVTFLISSFFEVVVPKIFPAIFKEEYWRSWKEIVYLLITTLFIGAANYILILYLYPRNTSLQGFLKAELITLQIGVFPILFTVFMKQMLMYRRFAEEAKEVSDDIRVQEEKAPTLSPPLNNLKIILKGDNQKEELQLFPQELLYISSADNYVEANYADGNKRKSLLMRSSLRKMEEQLAGHENFFRCHRMYIVNLQLVTALSGNAQGLKLHMQGLDEAIPVSRNFTETVKEKLHQLSHSPQKA